MHQLVLILWNPSRVTGTDHSSSSRGSVERHRVAIRSSLCVSFGRPSEWRFTICLHGSWLNVVGQMHKSLALP